MRSLAGQKLSWDAGRGGCRCNIQRAVGPSWPDHMPTPTFPCPRHPENSHHNTSSLPQPCNACLISLTRKLRFKVDRKEVPKATQLGCPGDWNPGLSGSKAPAKSVTPPANRGDACGLGTTAAHLSCSPFSC